MNNTPFPKNTLNLKSICNDIVLYTFSNQAIVITVNVLFTIGFAILTSFCTTVNNPSLWVWLVMLTIIYIVFLVISHKVTNRKKKLEEYSEIIFECLKEQQNIELSITNFLFKHYKRISETFGKQERINKKLIKEVLSFQNISFAVCQSIYNIISKKIDCAECQVTVYRVFCDEKSEYVKMIGYSNGDSKCPSSYYKEHILNSDEINKPLITKIFENKQDSIIILTSKKEIKRKFVFFNESLERESGICQYIGIPVKCNSGIISFVLQVDVSKENALGSNLNDMKDLARYLLTPYSNILHMMYELDDNFSQFYDEYNKLIERDNNKYEKIYKNDFSLV